MSGVEIVGLVGSVLQIADLGGKLSVGLFMFARKVKNANKSIDALSQELASTGAVLKQLGETLNQDERLRLCSQEAITTATNLVEDIKKAFTSLEAFIDNGGDSGTKGRKSYNLKQRIKFPFVEPQIEQLRANLERLKSSLLVILNVLIFAGQLRNQEALPVLKDQRELLRTLAAEQDINERRYELILRAISNKPSSASSSVTAVDDEGHRDQGLGFDYTSLNLSATTSRNEHFTMSPTNTRPPSSTRALAIPTIDLPLSLRHHHERIQHHSYLVETLLSEISSLQYKLDHGTRDRMHNGLLDLHWNEWARHRNMHGFQTLDKILANHEEIARYWTDRFFTEQGTAQGILLDDVRSKEEKEKKNEEDEYPKIEETFRRTAFSARGSGKLMDRSTDQEDVPLDMARSGYQEEPLTLEDPWRSNLPHHRRPSIEITAPEHVLRPDSWNDARRFSSDPLIHRVRPTISIPASPASPTTSGGQTPISPSELIPTKRLSYERLRSPTGSTQASPAASPYLRKATLNLAYTTSPPESTSELTRRGSKKEATRLRAERAPSGTYDEQLLSPSGARRPSAAKDKPSGTIKLKDPLGRKFKCPLQKCTTWEEMHNLIEAQFHQHEELFPEVQADKYDLFLADGQRIPIADWATVATSGLRVTMLLRYGNPAAGFRRKDCLIPFDGEHILAPDMLHYITKQEPHNAYRTKMISYNDSVYEEDNGHQAVREEDFQDESEMFRRERGQLGVERSEEEEMCLAREKIRSEEHHRGSASAGAASKPVLDDVDMLVLRLTNIEASELNLILSKEESRSRAY